VGHALEIAGHGQHVVWQNDATGVRCELIPADGRRSGGRTCR